MFRFILLICFSTMCGLINSISGQCNIKCYGKKLYPNDSLQLKKFAIEKKWHVDSILMYQTPLIMDVLNNDNIPEIIVGKPIDLNLSQYLGNGIVIIDTKEKKKVKLIETAFFNIFSVGTFIVADINNDCTKEIIVATADDSKNPEGLRSKLVCYDLSGNIIWISNKKYGENLPPLEALGSGMGLADFNQDGIAELFIYNEIFNATNGVKLLSGGKNGLGFGASFGGSGSISIACNLDNDLENLELIAGYSVYKVDIKNANGEIGNTIRAINMSLNGQYIDGCTAIGDINRDGKSDVIVASNGYFNQGPNLNEDIGLYCYTIDSDTAKFIANLGRITNGQQWLNNGPLTLGKTSKDDNDLSIIFLNKDNTKSELRGYKYDGSDNLNFEWNQIVNDPSKLTGLTMFDLNNDGIVEIIHRDEEKLRVINVKNSLTTILFEATCYAGTGWEKPIVGDIDGSGQAKICVTCAANTSDRNGKLTIFGAPPGQKWAPARNIWHQYAYNPLFINGDGTVPQNMHNPATYKNGKYNNFMVQESLIDEDGSYPVAAASLTGSISCINYDVATQQYTVDFSINNRADASASAVSGVSVSFYNGNPETGGTLLGVYSTLADINAGNTLGSLSYAFSASNLTALWMIVNTDKYPITVADTSYYGIDECDYTDNVFIAPAPVVSQSVQQICQGDSYDFFGIPLTNAGIYYHEKQDRNGCDSVVVALSLQVGQVKTADVYTAACDTYTWNGTIYTTDGDYPYQILSANGCDSITTLHLRLFQSNDVALNQQSCDSYTWRGQTYTSSGNYTYQTKNIHGCDSVVTLNLKINPSYTLASTYAACDTYTWNGTTYTDSGIYTYQTQTRYGCDSTVTLNLTISDILRTNHPVTACDTYTWNGNTYDTDGDYTYQTISTNGCDSIATLILTLNASSSNTIQQTACESYNWNGVTYDQSGNYTFATKNRYGCDSIINLDLTVNTSSISTTDISACGQYTWNGKTYTTSTTDTYQTINAYGCDSVATLRLNIHQPDNIVTQQNACNTYQWNVQTYTQSGTYTYQTQNRFGCDSITTLNLSVHPSDAVSLQLTECDTVVYLGQTLSASGIYTFNLQNRYGCDSVVTLDLTISADRIASTQTACEAYTWPINGQRYTQSGKYTQSYTNALGCDSTYTLDLIVNPNYDIPVNAEACAQYIWPVTQLRYTQSGLYTAPFQTAMGCDSIFRLDLVIHPEFEFRDTVISTTPYFWPINNQTYETSGTYSQTFSTDVSCDSIHYLYLTIKNSTDITFPNIISPDGPNGFFTGFSNNTSLLITNLSVYDRWGNLIFTKENLPVNDPQQGWDGKLEGRDVVQGVYTWLAKVQLKDGSAEVFYGDVTVVR